MTLASFNKELKELLQRYGFLMSSITFVGKDGVERTKPVVIKAP